MYLVEDLKEDVRNMIVLISLVIWGIEYQIFTTTLAASYSQIIVWDNLSIGWRSFPTI